MSAGATPSRVESSGAGVLKLGEILGGWVKASNRESNSGKDCGLFSLKSRVVSAKNVGGCGPPSLGPDQASGPKGVAAGPFHFLNAFLI